MSQTPGKHLFNNDLNIWTIVPLSVPVPSRHHAVDHKPNCTEYNNKCEIASSTARFSTLKIQGINEIRDDRKKDRH